MSNDTPVRTLGADLRDVERYQELLTALEALNVKWLTRTGPRWPSEGPAYQHCADELDTLLRPHREGR